MTKIETQHWIGGTWCGSHDQRTGASIDPATGQVLGYFADGGEAEALAAIAAARIAFAGSPWPQSPRLRQQIMLQWADRLAAKADDLAILLTSENGKIISQARGELAASISEIRYYAGLTRHLPGHVLEVEPGVFSTVLREPAGVAAIIVPWNAPAVLLVRSLAPALAAGCTAIVKPAPQTTLFTARMMAELADVPGLPAGVVNLVGETGHGAAATLAASTAVDVLSFTGSTRTGKQIMIAAADSVKKLSLELGGKACCVVFPDVDIADVAGKLAAAATIISGQQCTAARRVLVHRSCFGPMRAALGQALAGLEVGPGLAARSAIGPLIDAAARGRVEEQVLAAFDSADEVILRGARPDGALADGAYLTPSLVAHDDPSSWFCQQEIFGPFVVLECFDDEQEAVQRANNTVFGLAASVWTRDGARALRIARALRNGTVWINDHNKLFAEAEMGGYGQSGLGRLHGFEGLADFTELKHIYQNVGVV